MAECKLKGIAKEFEVSMGGPVLKLPIKTGFMGETCRIFPVATETRGVDIIPSGRGHIRNARDLKKEAYIVEAQ